MLTIQTLQNVVYFVARDRNPHRKIQPEIIGAVKWNGGIVVW
jgi:hypothetical protein